MKSGWDMVLEWVGTAKHDVRILPVEKEVSERELRSLQVTTKSIVGQKGKNLSKEIDEQCQLKSCGI